MMSNKYYKPKKKREVSEVHTEQRKKLFFDKRVKQIFNCEECDMPITMAESRRNGGLCDSCISIKP